MQAIASLLRLLTVLPLAADLSGMALGPVRAEEGATVETPVALYLLGVVA